MCGRIYLAMSNDLNLNNKILEFQNVSKKYDDDPTVRLSDINFSVFKNEFICLVGPSGCGKSTILEITAGIEKNSSGKVLCDSKISMVFQNGALLPWLTVSQNIALALESLAISNDKIEVEVKKYLTMMKLENFADIYPTNLSGGQRQRVGIARALAVHPELLLLDEPFSALDEKTSAELYEDLLKICKEMNIAVLMTTHKIEEVVTLADRVLVVANGKILKDIVINIPHPRRNSELLFIKSVNEIRTVLFAE